MHRLVRLLSLELLHKCFCSVSYTHLAVVLVLLAIIGNMRKGGKGTEPVVEVISVEKGDVRQEIEASGNVESEWKKTFYSPVNATIENMTVEAGDSVEAGQKLIAFNVDNLEADNQKDVYKRQM